MPAYADLYDDRSFPTWDHIPSNFFLGRNTQHRPQDKHWCFLAEIQQCDGFLRYRTVVKDDNDEEMVVAFYPDSYEGFDWNKLKRGHTLAIMYAYQHSFVDGSYGVRIENMDHVHVIPLPLEELQYLGAEMNEYSAGVEEGQWKCHGCGEIKPSSQISRCGRCKLVGYCGKECQAKGWSERGHKKHCKVIQDSNFMALMKLDFSRYERAFAFTRD